jgi:hypothetical protein
MLCEYGIFLQSILLSNYTVCLGTKTSPIFFTISNLRLDLLYLFNLFSQSLPLLVTCYLSLFRISGLHYSWGWFRFGSFFMDFSLFKKNLFYWFFFLLPISAKVDNNSRRSFSDSYLLPTYYSAVGGILL